MSIDEDDEHDDGDDAMPTTSRWCMYIYYFIINFIDHVDIVVRCEIRSSEAIVPLRETVLKCESAHWTRAVELLPPPWQNWSEIAQVSGGRYRQQLCSKGLYITLRAMPLPMRVAAFLEKSCETFAALKRTGAFSLERKSNMTTTTTMESGDDAQHHDHDRVHDRLNEFAENMQKVIAVMVDDNEVFDACLFGPRESASASSFLNRVIDCSPGDSCTNALMFSSEFSIAVYDTLTNDQEKPSTPLFTEKPLFVSSSSSSSSSLRTLSTLWSRVISPTIAGFELASLVGPLMQERMHGVCFAVEKIEVFVPSTSVLFEHEAGDASAINASWFSSAVDELQMQSGIVISQMKEAFHVAFMGCPVRIVEPVFACELQCDQSQIGSLYGVIHRRRGVIKSEDVIEGTSLFLISAELPVSESFGFGQELLKKTSGRGTTPQMSFSHWQLLDEDPFWRPSTQEELESFGEFSAASMTSTARITIDRVRKRKGLPVEEKTVVSAEKQRNMNKKK